MDCVYIMFLVFGRVLVEAWGGMSFGWHSAYFLGHTIGYNVFFVKYKIDKFLYFAKNTYICNEIKMYDFNITYYG